MSDLDALRNKLTPEQRSVLNLLWEEFRDRNRWLPRAELHARLGEEKARSLAAELGAPVLRQGRENADEDYRLTFLGVLLADQGRESEALLIRYLTYVRGRVEADPRLEWVGSRDVEAALDLAPVQSRHLRQLVRLSHWWGGGSGFGQREWTVGVPIDVEELPAGDLGEYVSRHVLTHFLPGAPNAGLHIVPSQPQPASRPPFGFLRDQALAARLAADWHEAQDVYQVRGWKSCVLLCGAILETLLRSALADARFPPGKGAGGQGLAALAQDAVGCRLLPGPLPLTPAIEQYRGLVEAGSRHDVGAADADAALHAVRNCLEALAVRPSGRVRDSRADTR